MNQQEQQILHHHAAAILWLCQQLSQGENSAEDWQKAALRHALILWETQTPEQLSEDLNRILTTLQTLVTEDNDPVVLWDEETGGITDSQLIEIVETVRLEQRHP